MGTLGISRVHLAIINDDSVVQTGNKGIYKFSSDAASDTTGIFTVDETTSFGVASLNLTNLAGSLTDIYGSNKIVWVAQGKAAPQAVLTVNALPNAVKMAILGKEKSAGGGYTLGGKSNTTLALLAESSESFDEDEPIYVALYKVIGQEASANMQTNNAAENRTQDAITFKAMERGNDGFGKFFFASDSSFDENAMVADVFNTTQTLANVAQVDVSTLEV